MSKFELLYYKIKAAYYKIKALYYETRVALSLNKDNKIRFSIAAFCYNANYMAEKMCIKAGCYE